MKDLVRKYTYRIFWSDEDRIYIAQCAELPSMSALGRTPAAALKEIYIAVQLALEWMEEENEYIPQPIGTQEFKGKISLRTTPEMHKSLAVRAAESGVSINQYVLSKLG